ANEKDAAVVARRFAAELAMPFEYPTRRISITASVGVATSAEAGRDPGELVGDADTAMYRAKRNGRARYEFFETESPDEAVFGNQKRTVKQRSPRGPSA